jgi:hypothetical protein
MVLRLARLMTVYHEKQMGERGMALSYVLASVFFITKH